MRASDTRPQAQVPPSVAAGLVAAAQAASVGSVRNVSPAELRFVPFFGTSTTVSIVVEDDVLNREWRVATLEPSM